MTNQTENILFIYLFNSYSIAKIHLPHANKNIKLTIKKKIFADSLL